MYAVTQRIAELGPWAGRLWDVVITTRQNSGALASIEPPPIAAAHPGSWVVKHVKLLVHEAAQRLHLKDMNALNEQLIKLFASTRAEARRQRSIKGM